MGILKEWGISTHEEPDSILGQILISKYKLNLSTQVFSGNISSICD